MSGIVMAGAAYAVKPDNVTDGEIALLPPYCIDTEAFKYGHEYSKNRSPRAGHWVSLMGKGFWSLHHYCWGLVELRRVQRAGKSAPHYKGRLRQIIGEYNYVIKNTTPDFVLLPEVWVRIGEALVLVEDWTAAQEAYAKSRALKPDYWPAYTQWAEVLIKQGQSREAATLIREGLERAPTAEPLLALARQLGVSMPSKAEASAPSNSAISPATPSSAASAASAPAGSAGAMPTN